MKYLDKREWRNTIKFNSPQFYLLLQLCLSLSTILLQQISIRVSTYLINWYQSRTKKTVSEMYAFQISQLNNKQLQQLEYQDERL